MTGAALAETARSARPDDLLSVEEVAEILGVSRAHVLRDCQTGALEAERHGVSRPRWMIRRKAVTKFAQKRAAAPTAEPDHRPNDLLSISEAAEILELDRSWVLRNCHSGLLKAQKVGHNWVIRWRDLEAFAETPRPLGLRHEHRR